MNKIADRNSPISKVLTLVILLLGALAALIIIGQILGKPDVPMRMPWWIMLSAFLGFMGTCIVAGKRAKNILSPWAYLLDFLVAGVTGIAYFSMEYYVAGSQGSAVWRIAWLFVLAFFLSMYLEARHPKSISSKEHESKKGMK